MKTNIQPCLTLLYDQPVIDLPDPLGLALAISSVEGNPHAENIQLTVRLHVSDKLAATLDFEVHTIHILGAGMPLPKQFIERLKQTSHWQGRFTDALSAHQAQIVLSYAGDAKDALEKMLALYKTAHALRNEHLLAVVNEPAWTAHPVLDTLDPERIRSYREVLPFILWFGYIKLPLNPEVFFLITKGHNIFRLPELAWLCQPGVNLADVMNHFFNVFYYMQKVSGKVQPGDTLEIVESGTTLRFGELPDLDLFEPWQVEPQSTLLLEKIDPTEVNSDRQ